MAEERWQWSSATSRPAASAILNCGGVSGWQTCPCAKSTAAPVPPGIPAGSTVPGSCGAGA